MLRDAARTVHNLAHNSAEDFSCRPRKRALTRTMTATEIRRRIAERRLACMPVGRQSAIARGYALRPHSSSILAATSARYLTAIRASIRDQVDRSAAAHLQ
jgi:hypothetical protein